MSVRSFIIRISFAIIAPFIGWIADKQSLSSAFYTMGIIGVTVISYCLIWFYKNQKNAIDIR